MTASHKEGYKKVATALIMTLLVLILSAPAIRVGKASATLVSIDYNGSSTILDPTLVLGTQFQVNVAVDYVEVLWAYQFELGKALFGIPGWNPSVLSLVSVVDGGFLGSAGGAVQFFMGTIDKGVGTLTLTAAALDPNRRWPTGGGALATLTFEVVGIGQSPIHFGLDTALLNKTGGYELGPDWKPLRGTLNPDFLVDGYFDNRPMGAELTGHSAWPEHHHYSISRDADPGESYGTPGYQTLIGKVKNTGTADVYVRVVLDITKVGGSPIQRTTSTQLTTPGQIVEVTFDFGPFTADDVGKYTVSARAECSPNGVNWLQGQKIKTFTFSIVP